MPFARRPTISTVDYASLAALLGLSDEEAEPKLIAARYRKYRQASQQIHLATRARRQRARKLARLLAKHSAVLPPSLRPVWEEIRRQDERLEELLTQLLVGTSQPKTSALTWRRLKSAAERFNARQQALVWWRYCLHQGRGWQGKIWEDMYQLARAWRLTDCKDVDEFKRVVVRLSKGLTEMPPPPKWCLKLGQAV